MHNLVRCLERNALRWPNAEAVICGSQRITHGQLDARVRATAAGLRERGISEGDVVAILLGNSAEFLEITLAINAIGAIFLPLNTRLALPEWAYIIGHSGAQGLVTSAEFAASLDELRESCPHIGLVVSVGPTEGADVELDALRAQQPGNLEYAAVAESAVSRLMYTSGTTARPKGVPLTYGNVQWKIFDHLIEFGLTHEDRTLMTGPMYHVGAYDLPGTGTLYVGGSLVILPRFDPAAVLDAVEREMVTNLWLAPAMVNALLQFPLLGEYFTGTVRFITNGGEKMPVTLIERFLKVFPNAWLADAFGMTETVSGDTFLDPDHTLTKLGSVGRPVLHLEAKIVDDNDEETAPDAPGELLLRGPKVFRGYWRDEDATRKAFVDGWFRTGDIAHRDADGYLFIDDRKKDMIVSGGENIASPEVERVIYGHPAVLEVAVVAEPDPRWGEVPKAVVVLKPGSAVTGDEIIDFCRTQLAKFKVPKYVEFRDALPRTPSGKVLKRSLR
jgi:acyl-CoA synthetase (AMP-forming)/AMP-acid ligase II